MAKVHAESPLGYVLYGHDNGAYFYEPRRVPAGTLCPSCKTVLKKEYFPVTLPMKTRLDVSSTYDNQAICSEKFVAKCKELKLPGIKFQTLFGLDGKYYVPAVKREVAFDAARRKTRFMGKCKSCGNYEEVIGATPAYLVGSVPLARGFFRTDIEFGSGQGKHPLLLVDTESGDQLKEGKFKGLDFHPIHR